MDLSNLHPEPIPLSYQELRQLEYPTLGDQLDNLWHAMNNNVIPIVEPFYTNIKTIKEKYPKV